MKLRNIVIVGAGLAGSRAAEMLRTEGFDGRVLLVGEEHVAPYERPALSKEFLAGTRSEESLLLRPESSWGERGIELMLGERVVAVDAACRRLRMQRGSEHSFDALVLATGARPRHLPLATPSGVHELRTLADARALRSDLVPGAYLVIVGGGFVGAEVASTAVALGVRVTVVEAAPAPAARVLGRRVGLLLAERWQARGVDVRLGVGVDGFRTDAGGRLDSILLTDGSVLRADAALVGVGVEPARELVPERPTAHVVLAGDLVGPGHWTAAASDGVAAARRLLGLPVAAPQPHYVWSDQFGLRLQVVGTPGPDDAIEIDGDGDRFAVWYRDRAGRLTAALLANRPEELGAVRRAVLGETAALAA